MISAFKESVYNLPKMMVNIGNYTHNNKMLASLYVNQIGMNNDEKFRNLNYNQLGRALSKHWAWGGWTLCDVLFKT
jgi:YD repeat-containing protein